jgi:hypothetical protein
MRRNGFLVDGNFRIIEEEGWWRHQLLSNLDIIKCECRRGD